MIAGAEWGGGGLFGGAVRCHSPLFFPDIAVCHGPLVIHWYHTCVNDMNKTDVIKIGPAPSLPSPRSLSPPLWGEKKHSKWCCSPSLTLLLSLFTLRLSFCFSFFHPSPLHSFWSPGLRGLTEHRGWAVQTPTPVQRESSRGGKKRAKKLKEGCAFVWVRACVCLWAERNCHISAYWATWSQINRGIMQLHTAGRATLGGIKTEDEDTEEQIGSESRTGENLRDKVLTVGVFESVWQGGVKEWKCEWMVHVSGAKVQGYRIGLDCTLQIFGFLHSISKI